MRALLIAASLALIGCTVPLEKARTAGMRDRVTGSESYVKKVEERCQKLDSQETFWGGVTVGAAALSGASGLSTIPLGDDKNAQMAMVITAGTVAAAGAVSAYVQRRKASTWALECSER